MDLKVFYVVIISIDSALSLTISGYGFVDFELAPAAEAAVQALQSKGIQVQMAKVRSRLCTGADCMMHLMSEHILLEHCGRQFDFIRLTVCIVEVRNFPFNVPLH